MGYSLKSNMTVSKRQCFYRRSYYLVTRIRYDFKMPMSSSDEGEMRKKGVTITARCRNRQRLRQTAADDR